MYKINYYYLCYPPRVRCGRDTQVIVHTFPKIGRIPNPHDRPDPVPAQCGETCAALLEDQRVGRWSTGNCIKFFQYASF